MNMIMAMIELSLQQPRHMPMHVSLPVTKFTCYKLFGHYEDAVTVILVWRITCPLIAIFPPSQVTLNVFFRILENVRLTFVHSVMRGQHLIR